MLYDTQNARDWAWLKSKVANMQSDCVETINATEECNKEMALISLLESKEYIDRYDGYFDYEAVENYLIDTRYVMTIDLELDAFSDLDDFSQWLACKSKMCEPVIGIEDVKDEYDNDITRDELEELLEYADVSWAYSYDYDLTIYLDRDLAERIWWDR